VDHEAKVPDIPRKFRGMLTSLRVSSIQHGPIGDNPKGTKSLLAAVKISRLELMF
jgi:hypothetical protein